MIWPIRFKLSRCGIVLVVVFGLAVVLLTIFAAALMVAANSSKRFYNVAVAVELPGQCIRYRLYSHGGGIWLKKAELTAVDSLDLETASPVSERRVQRSPRLEWYSTPNLGGDLSDRVALAEALSVLPDDSPEDWGPQAAWVIANDVIYLDVSYEQAVAIPGIGAAALMILGGGIVLRRRVVLSQRLREGLCAVCGYDLRASDHVCPECGNVLLRQRQSSDVALS